MKLQQSANPAPVFFDPAGRRWKLIVWSVSSVVALVGFLAVFLIISLVRPSNLTPIDRSSLADRQPPEDNRRVVLTFDDGPDPVYTPLILDILKEHETPAVFFVIGANAVREPGLLKRIIAEDHEIGNHTFSHPRISDLAISIPNWEINGPQLVLQGPVGRTTRLLRIPTDETNDSHSGARSSIFSSLGERGYLNVGIDVDPKDWQPRVTPAQIASRVVANVTAGTRNMVLLHDGGGDRSSTVEALPTIIASLRARGFEIVSLAELIRIPREQIMPPVIASDRMAGYASCDAARPCRMESRTPEGF